MVAIFLPTTLLRAKASMLESGCVRKCTDTNHRLKAENVPYPGGWLCFQKSKTLNMAQKLCNILLL